MKRQSTHARVLRRAMVALGGELALQAYLGVSQANLERWLTGEEPPMDVFLRAIDVVLDPGVSAALALSARLADLDDRAAVPAAAREGILQFRVGQAVARCPTCDCIDFRPSDSTAPMTNTSSMQCVFCERELARGDLIVLAGKEAVEQSRAAVAALKKRQRQAQARHAKPVKDAS